MSKCRLHPIVLDPKISERWLLPCIHDSERLASLKHQGLPMPATWPDLPRYELNREFDHRGMRPSPRLVLELCCGLGDFLARMAAEEPDARYVGVDHAVPVAQRAARLIGTLQLENALVYRGKLEDFFDHDCPGDRFDLIMINFPDPWPKNRHQKRRVVQPPIVPRLEKALKPMGLLVTATDILPLHEEHAAVLDASTKWVRLNRENREQAPLAVYQCASNYEKKGRAMGRGVYYTAHRLQAEPG